jgi:tetratricopeptide (TPR) repeat protein
MLVQAQTRLGRYTEAEANARTWLEALDAEDHPRARALRRDLRTALLVAVAAERRGDEVAALLAADDDNDGEVDTETRIRSLQSRSNALRAVHRHDEADVLHFEALELARCTGNVRAQAQLLHRRGSVAADAGQYDEARGWFEQAEQAYVRCGDVIGQGRCDSAIAMVELGLGQVGAAIVRLERLVPKLADQGQVQVALAARMYLGIADHLAGRLERARRGLAEAASAAAESPLPTLRIGIALHLAAVEAELGLDGAGRLGAVRGEAAQVSPGTLRILEPAVAGDAVDGALAEADRTVFAEVLAVGIAAAMVRRR